MNIQIINPSCSRFWLEKTVSGSNVSLWLCNVGHYHGQRGVARISEKITEVFSARKESAHAVNTGNFPRSTTLVQAEVFVESRPFFLDFYGTWYQMKQKTFNPFVTCYDYFLSISSLEKGVWNMSNNKLLRIVTCRKQKAKESDLENICGRASSRLISESFGNYIWMRNWKRLFIE